MGDHQNPADARHSNGDKTLFRYGSGYVTAKGSPNTPLLGMKPGASGDFV